MSRGSIQSDPVDLARRFEDLEAKVRADIEADEALENTPVVFERAGDMRYHGQEHTVKIELPAGPIGEAALDDWSERFRTAHDRMYRVRLDVPVEIVNLHLVAFSLIAKPSLVPRTGTGAPLGVAEIGIRQVDFAEAGVHPARVYDRSKLEPQMRLDGPAIVEERGAVTLILPGQTAEVDQFENLIIRIGG